MEDYPHNLTEFERRFAGKLFYRPAQQAVAVDPVPRKSMVGGVANKDFADHKM